MPNQSVRFTAGGQEYIVGSLSPGVPTTFTVVTWARIAVDRNNYSSAWCLDNGSEATAGALQTDSGGTIMRLVDAGTTHDLVTMTVGTWYCFAVTRSALSGATSLRALYGTAPTSLTALAATPTNGWTTASFSRLRIGESEWGGEWINGNVAFTKVWGRVLTDPEIETELSYYNPVSTSSLYAAYSFWDGPSVTDQSGNGRTLTGGSGTSAEAGPAGIEQEPGGGEPGTTETFGNIADGGVDQTTSSTTKISISQATATGTGTLVTGHARVWVSGGSSNTRLVVYADNGADAPGVRLAISDDLAVTGTTEAQRDYTFSGINQISITPGTYWLGVMWSDPGTPNVVHSRGGIDNVRWERSANVAPTWTYPNAPDSFGTPEGPFTGPTEVWVDYLVPSDGAEPGRFMFAAA